MGYELTLCSLDEGFELYLLDCGEDTEASHHYEPGEECAAYIPVSSCE